MREAMAAMPRIVAHALLALTTLLAGACAAGPHATRVVSVGDGDTIRVRRGDAVITVRLACIDAPEMAQTPHGERARRALQERLPAGRRVRLAEKGTDRYGRLVAEVIADGNINLALVEDGQAFAYHRYLRRCDGEAYRDAERRARHNRLGVWSVPDGITRPWNFRRGRSTSPPQRPSGAGAD